MPDILIRGFELPDEPMAITIMPNGEVYDFFIDNKLGTAIELPTHGDLIEAEPVKRFITDGLNRKEFGYDQIQVLTEVEYAPVIVPASDEVK